MQEIEKKVPSNLSEYCDCETLQQLLKLKEVQENVAGDVELGQYMEMLNYFNSQQPDNAIDTSQMKLSYVP